MLPDILARQPRHSCHNGIYVRLGMLYQTDLFLFFFFFGSSLAPKTIGHGRMIILFLVAVSTGS